MPQKSCRPIKLFRLFLRSDVVWNLRAYGNSQGVVNSRCAERSFRTPRASMKRACLGLCPPMAMPLDTQKIVVLPHLHCTAKAAWQPPSAKLFCNCARSAGTKDQKPCPPSGQDCRREETLLRCRGSHRLRPRPGSISVHFPTFRPLLKSSYDVSAGSFGGT